MLSTYMFKSNLKVHKLSKIRSLTSITYKHVTTYDTLKDEKFTISLIGRPNVGKSTLFNTLMGQQIALVDKMPGLTRDRREGITNVFDLPIRIVDTAGFENVESIDDQNSRSLNKRMMHDMILQTRNALIYSDLAVFMVDCQTGIHPHDLALHKWITQRRLQFNKGEIKVG